MAGVLETLNDRRAYYESLQKSKPGDYVQAMGSQAARLAKQVGQKDSPVSGLDRMFNMQETSAQRRERARSAQSSKERQESKALGERSIKNIKEVRYELGNDLNTMQNTLAGILKDLLKSSKNIEGYLKYGQGGGSIFDLMDDFGGRRRGRRRGASRRAARMRVGRAARGAKGAIGRAAGSVRNAAGRLFGRGGGAKPPPLPGASGAAGAASRGGVRGALGSVSNAGGRALQAGGRAASAIGRGVSGVGSKAAGLVGGGGGAALARRAGAAGAIAAGGYTVYQTLKDDTKTDAEKAKTVAGTAGGTAGALALGAAGAQGGAAIGTMIFPGVGTAVGGAIGGLGGGALGYFGGEKIVTNTIDSVNDKISESGVGDHIGRAVAMVMTPFSEEARDAVKSDFKNNILPGWKKTIEPLGATVASWGQTVSSYTDSFMTTLGGWKDQLAGLFDKLPQFAQDALKGAGTAIMAPVKGLVQGATWAGGKALDALSSTGSTGAKIAQGVRNVGNAAVSALPAGLAGSLGFVSAKYESGGRGVNTISTGKGDHGGVSYGKHQLATNNGSMAKFLASAQGQKYGAQFAGLKPGTKEFNDRYKQVVGSDAAGMEKAQQDYIVATHYNPLAGKVAKETGLDVNQRGRAVQEAIMSTSVQYGGGTSVITQALKGKDPSKMTDAEIVNAVQDYKAATVGTKFKSSSQATRDSIARRIENERRDLLGVAADDAGGKKGPADVAEQKRVAVGSTGDAKPKAGETVGVKPEAAPVAAAKPASTAAPASPVGKADGPAVVTSVAQGPAVQTVKPGTPAEVKPVAVVSQPPPPKAPDAPKPTVVAVGGGGSGGSGGIGFDDIPAFLPDPSMAPILFGRG